MTSLRHKSTQHETKAELLELQEKDQVQRKYRHTLRAVDGLRIAVSSRACIRTYSFTSCFWSNRFFGSQEAFAACPHGAGSRSCKQDTSRCAAGASPISMPSPLIPVRSHESPLFPPQKIPANLRPLTVILIYTPISFMARRFP